MRRSRAAPVGASDGASAPPAWPRQLTVRSEHDYHPKFARGYRLTPKRHPIAPDRSGRHLRFGKRDRIPVLAAMPDTSRRS